MANVSPSPHQQLASKSTRELAVALHMAFSSLTEAFTCALCHRVMENPHRSVVCNHCACRECFFDHVKDYSNCFQCKVPVFNKDLEHHRQLEGIIRTVSSMDERAKKDSYGYVGTDADADGGEGTDTNADEVGVGAGAVRNRMLTDTQNQESAQMTVGKNNAGPNDNENKKKSGLVMEEDPTDLSPRPQKLIRILDADDKVLHNHENKSEFKMIAPHHTKSIDKTTTRINDINAFKTTPKPMDREVDFPLLYEISDSDNDPDHDDTRENINNVGIRDLQDSTTSRNSAAQVRVNLVDRFEESESLDKAVIEDRETIPTMIPTNNHTVQKYPDLSVIVANMNDDSLIEKGSIEFPFPNTKVAIAFTNIDDSKKCNSSERLNKMVENIGAVNLNANLESSSLDESEHISQATHLVCCCDQNRKLKRRSLKYMHALLRGIWIVDVSWLEESNVAGFVVPEDKFEVLGDVFSKSDQDIPAPRRAREHAQRQKYLSETVHGLFSGWNFVLLGECKRELERLILVGGGKIIDVDAIQDVKSTLKETRERNIIIVDSEAHLLEEASSLGTIKDLEWLIEAITTWKCPLVP